MANILACNLIVRGIKKKMKQQINTSHGINFIYTTWQYSYITLHSVLPVFSFNYNNQQQACESQIIFSKKVKPNCLSFLCNMIVMQH